MRTITFAKIDSHIPELDEEDVLAMFFRHASINVVDSVNDRLILEVFTYFLSLKNYELPDIRYCVSVSKSTLDFLVNAKLLNQNGAFSREPGQYFNYSITEKGKEHITQNILNSCPVKDGREEYVHVVFKANRSFLRSSDVACRFAILIAFTGGMTGVQKNSAILEEFNAYIGFIVTLILTAAYLYLMPKAILKYGEYENYCKRLEQVRDDKAKLVLLLEHEIQYNSQYELYRFLLNVIIQNRARFKSASESLEPVMSYLGHEQKLKLNEHIRYLKNSMVGIDNTFKDTSELLSTISNSGIRIVEAKLLSENIKKALESIEGKNLTRPTLQESD